ncbi:unnamed protein product [Peronospora belbahrii]|uniref:Uncharacterized protein n=1 Tax=Peronospora belbahrii TaxID=622444 RepID=A0ABN8CUM2_9STRA|nr:unnamed protein product [Peronospora belbahrii]
MASIYFYYNELLRHCADETVTNDTYSPGGDFRQQQQHGDMSFEKKHQELTIHHLGQLQSIAVKSQDEDKALKAQCMYYPSTEATFVTLQPRMNRLAYLQTAVATNLDALIRSLGPKL